MEKVTGYAYYRVDVRCPSCGDTFTPTDNDCDNLIVDAMFTNTEESCTDMDIEITCPYCDEDMILDNLEY